MIGGEKTEQECFLQKLSAKIPLQDTNQLGDKNPLIFQNRSLELNQAEKSISLSLTSAFIQQLLFRHNLQDAPATSLPQEELEQEASGYLNLDASRTKLYRETVGALVWASMSRPDISFWAQTLAKSFANPTETNQRQLEKVLLYLKGTRHFSISLQPPRKLERANCFELIAFSGTAWPEVGRSIMNVSLFLMGVPLATSTTTQATTPKETQLASVRLACRMAFHTKLLLRQLRVEKTLSLRVLLGGPLASQLGLSRKARHLDLFSWFGQFQLSKVGPQSNLAESLTYNLGTSGLHRLLLKLKMHTRAAEELALHTELGFGEVASFESSMGSFFIGSLTQTPAMEQLCASQPCSDQLLDEKLSGKEVVDHLAILELQPSGGANTALHNELRKTTFQPESSLTEDKLEQFQGLSLQQDSLHSQSLATDQREEDSLHSQSLATDQLTAAYSQGSLQSFQPVALNRSTRSSKLCASDGSTRALDQLSAFTSSLRASRKHFRASAFSIFSSLILAFVIISLTFQSLSFVFRTDSLNCISLSFQNRLPTDWADELAELDDMTLQNELLPTLGDRELVKNELRRTCGEEEDDKKAELQNLLVDQELTNQLAEKSSWVDQLQENLLENDDHNQLDDNKKLEEKNFQSLIYEKLVALLLEWHFAKAASTQLLGNEAWKKSREASQISFDKVGDKELLQEELRRQELGYKDLWPAYCRALCPTNFEENSFTEETFSNTSLAEESFKDSTFSKKSFDKTSFAKSSFTESSLTKNSLTEKSFEKNSLTEKSFAKNSLTKKSFDQTSFSENTFLEDSFSENSLENKTLPEQLRTQQLGGLELPLGSFDNSSFEESSFNQSSLEESSFTKSSFPTSSLRRSSFNKESFPKESLNSTAFTKSFAQKSFHRRSFNNSSLEESSFTKSSFQESSLEGTSFTESSFEENSFNNRSFEESSFAKSSLEESSLTTGSFEQSSFKTNSFELSDFEATSFTESSFQEASFPTETSFSTELSEPQRSSLRTELAALHFEQRELDGRALKKAASRLALTGERSLATLVETRHKTAWLQGGVLRGQLLPTSLTLPSMSFADMLGSRPCLPCLLQKELLSA